MVIFFDKYKVKIFFFNVVKGYFILLMKDDLCDDKIILGE